MVEEALGAGGAWVRREEKTSGGGGGREVQWRTVKPTWCSPGLERR
jgi:hypothetical protein